MRYGDLTVNLDQDAGRQIHRACDFEVVLYILHMYEYRPMSTVVLSRDVFTNAYNFEFSCRVYNFKYRSLESLDECSDAYSKMFK